MSVPIYDYLLCRFCVKYRKPHRKALRELKSYPTKILVQSLRAFCFVLFSFSVFCPNFGITSLALNTVSHFVSVFEYGCENEGLKYKEFSFIFYGKSFDSETIDDEESRAKQGFMSQIRMKGSKHMRS